MARRSGEFLLHPAVTYLNHGSYSACPRVVFEEHPRWQPELEPMRLPAPGTGIELAPLRSESYARERVLLPGSLVSPPSPEANARVTSSGSSTAATSVGVISVRWAEVLTR